MGKRVRDGVLVGEILLRRRQAHSGVAFLVERRVVASAAEPVGAEDGVDAHRRQVAVGGFADVAGQLARRRIVGILAEDAYAAVLRPAGAGNVAADDVVIEDGLNFLIRGVRLFSVQGTAEQPLFFSGESDEYQGFLKLVLAEDARQFHDAGGSGAIVGHAGGIEVGVAHGRSSARACSSSFACAGRAARSGGPSHHDGVVVAADDNPLLFIRRARQHGHDVVQIHIARHAGRAALDFLEPVLIEAHFEPGAVATELLIDPLAGRAHAARGIILRGENVARAEGFQFFENFRDALLVHLGNDLGHLRIRRLVLRGQSRGGQEKSSSSHISINDARERLNVTGGPYFAA